MEKMKELYAKVAGDKDLQAKFAEIMREAAQTREAAKEKLTAFAKEAGFEVSFDEVQEYFKALSGQKEGELSDAELDAVAGGKSAAGIFGVIVSVLGVGVACAIASAAVEIINVTTNATPPCREAWN